MILAIRLLLQDLDWSTPLRRARYRDHWRVSLPALAGSFVAFSLWHVLFPHTLWFFKVWGALATGGVLGAIVGYAWQLHDAGRRARTSGRQFAWLVTFGLGVLFPLAALELGPMLRREECELARIRSLTAVDVASVSIQRSGQPQVKLVDGAALTSFANNCRRSSLFYPSHERFENECLLAVKFADGTAWTYEAGVPIRHPADMAVSFRSGIGYSHILIPDGAKWLDRAAEGTKTGG